MTILGKGSLLYRGGACKTGMAFFTTDPKIARMYGPQVFKYKTKRKLKLFKVSHTSLKRVFKYLSPNTRLLLKFIFGTDTSRKNQSKILKNLFGNYSSHTKGSGKTPGQRISLAEIDSIVFRSFARELNGNYDGIYVPKRFTKFHKGGMFHSEVYISKHNLLDKVDYASAHTRTRVRSCSTSKSKSTFSHIPMTDLFIKYTKHTRGLLNPHPKRFVMFLSGGMAVKLYLKARGISTAKTNDFDFKFAVPRPLKTLKQIEFLSKLMKHIIQRHMNGFVKFLNKNGIPSSLEVRELEGVPLDKPGGDPNYKKVYKVFNFSVHSRGRKYELVDTSLVVVPGITRKKHLSLKWSRVFGFPIQTLTRLWKDTLYVLAGSFVDKKIMLRNPINGEKKEKGIKNAIRAGHLSYLTSKRRGTAYMVDLSRKLIENVAARNKKAGIRDSRKILNQLKLLQKLELSRGGG